MPLEQALLDQYSSMYSGEELARVLAVAAAEQARRDQANNQALVDLRAQEAQAVALAAQVNANGGSGACFADHSNNANVKMTNGEGIGVSCVTRSGRVWWNSSTPASVILAAIVSGNAAKGIVQVTGNAISVNPGSNTGNAGYQNVIPGSNFTTSASSVGPSPAATTPATTPPITNGAGFCTVISPSSGISLYPNWARECKQGNATGTSPSNTTTPPKANWWEVEVFGIPVWMFLAGGAVAGIVMKQRKEGN